MFILALQEVLKSFLRWAHGGNEGKRFLFFVLYYMEVIDLFLALMEPLIEFLT